MKNLLFILLIICSLKSFSQANQQITYWTGGSSQGGSNTFRFLVPGGGNVASLAIGPNAVFGNPINGGDSVNAAYTMYIANHHAGTGAYTGFVGANDLGHGADVILTSSGNTSLGGGDIAEYLSNAAGGYWLYSQAAPITFKSVGGVIPVKVTTTQMNAISSPVDGQTIYNTTTHDYWWYKNGTWTEDTGSGGSGGNTIYTGDGSIASGTTRLISGGGNSDWQSGGAVLSIGGNGTGQYFGEINLIANNGIQIGNNTGTIALYGAVSMSGQVAPDANYTLASNFVYSYLPQITANRTITLSALNQGQMVTLFDFNTSAFHWSIAGLTVKDLSGNTITTLTNGRAYNIINTGAGYITTIHQ